MDAKKAVAKGLEKALVAQQPVARANVERLRRLHPDKSPKQMIKHIDRIFLSTVTGTGAAAGAAGLVPGAAVPTALADALAFTEASVLYVLSLAEIHDLDPEDVERRKLLVITVLLGEGATGVLNKAIPHTGKHWAKQIVNKIPMSAINKANAVLGPRFITKYGTKQGVLVLSKQVPLGIGAALGGTGNHLFGRAVVGSARKIFGPPPAGWQDGEVPSGSPPQPHGGDASAAVDSLGEATISKATPKGDR